MKATNKKRVFVFDNEGQTFDRFTIITLHDGEVNGSSNNPFHPQGFGQCCGNVVQYRARRWERFYNYDTGEWNYKAIIKYTCQYIKEARENSNWIGKEVKRFTDLPTEVQKYVDQLTT